MDPIAVISAGPGSPEYLTRQAAEAIDRADAVWCAPRHEALIPRAKRRPLLPFPAAMDGIRRFREAGGNAAVLLSGDAGLYGMLGILENHFGREALRVYPGISSIQALCAYLGMRWQDARILSAHGRALSSSALCHFARTHSLVLLLMDEAHDPHWARQSLDSGGLSALGLIVGERLSYPDQRVMPYEPREYDPLCVAAILNDAPESGLPPVGIDDAAFIRGKTPMTKREIRAQVISALRLRPDAVVWDIGAGTGSVSVECARQCPLGTVYAVERDAEALELIGRNQARFRLQNIEIIAGAAPEALRDLPAPTHVFLGGTGGQAGAILRHLEGLDSAVSLCATAVSMESAAMYTRLLSGYDGFTAMQLAVSRLERAGGVRLFRAQNPVFVFSATLGGRT